jgi:plasmid replication initiation protein
MVKNNKLIVKSNYIVEASYKLSLGEQRVIYVLASMIKPDDKEFKDYRLTVKEFAEILGTKSKDMYAQVARYVEGLRDRDLTIIKEKSILKTKWLSSAEYFTDDGFVELCFDPKLKPYLLMLKERFTKLSVEQMVSFKSQYSGRIYELLKQYEKIGERMFKIDELKTLLGIGFDEYSKYGLFKQRILTKAKDEINLDSDLLIDFVEIKKSRKVESIRFIIKSNIKAIDEVCITREGKTPTKENETLCERINAIKTIFEENIENLEATKLLEVAKGDLSVIKEKYEVAKVTSGIKNIVGWMIQAIKDDYKEPIGKEKVHDFNNYEQRTYDYNDLERKLLGWDNEKDEATGKEYFQGKINL